MTVLNRLASVVAMTIRRLLSQKGLTLAGLLGLTSAVTLFMSVPLYIDAVFYRVLREELSDTTLSQGRPPFAFLFHHIGSWAGALPWEDVQAADGYLSGPAVSELGLPVEVLVRYVKTDRFLLFPQDTASYTNTFARLAAVNLGSITELQEHITLLEGSFPSVGFPAHDTIDVLLSEPLARETGLEIGETYVAFASRESDNVQFSVRVAGIWEPTDPAEHFWFRDPGTLKDVLLVPQETLAGLFGPPLDEQVVEALWYLVADDTGIRASDVNDLHSRILRVQAKTGMFLPQAIVTSPVEHLQRYQEVARLLTVLFYAFSTPAIGLNLTFIGLVAAMSVQRRRNEISILLSRGATRPQIVGMAALEGLLLGLLALAVGQPASRLVAQIVTRTRGFLDFTAPSSPQIYLTGRALSVGLIAVGLGLVTQIAPTIGAAQHTVVSYKQERARRLRAPLWQRIGLDFMLLVPAAYGTYLLDREDSLAPLGRGMDTNDPFQNPLLFLIPILTFSALTLLLVRVFPLIVHTLAWVASQTRSVSLVLAARQLSRMPGFYTAPLLLLTMTLSLSVFISSAAHSLDRYLYDQERYRLGAEMVLRPEVESIGPQEAADETTQGAVQARVARWFYVPLEDYRQVPGVQQAARVTRYTASPVLGSTQGDAVFMGVDRATLAQVAYWRQDFADDSLGTLMNALAVMGNGVLVPRSFLGEHGLNVGDPVRLSVRTYGQETELVLNIVGSFDLFPTWNPKWGPLFVGNLDYLFEQLGTELPATLWLKADPAVDPAQVKEALQRLNPHSVVVQPLFDRIAAEQQRPERQGLVGIFSVGFLSAALLAALGFTLYTVFSFRRRSIELGTLQSIGMSFWQMTGYLAWELFFLVLVGLVGGTWLGTTVSRLWIPHFRVGDIALSAALPLSVQVAWLPIYGVYALFGLLLVAVLTLSAITIRQFRISDAVKMVEAT